MLIRAKTKLSSSYSTQKRVSDPSECRGQISREYWAEETSRFYFVTIRRVDGWIFQIKKCWVHRRELSRNEIFFVITDQKTYEMRRINERTLFSAYPEREKIALCDSFYSPMLNYWERRRKVCVCAKHCMRRRKKLSRVIELPLCKPNSVSTRLHKHHHLLIFYFCFSCFSWKKLLFAEKCRT